jgi:hypothetical protein
MIAIFIASIDFFSYIVLEILPANPGHKQRLQDLQEQELESLFQLQLLGYPLALWSLHSC